MGQQAWRPVDASQVRTSRKRGKWNVVFALSLIVFIGALIALALIVLSYLQGRQTYDEIADLANFTAIDAIEEGPLEEVGLDWDALRAVNPDVVGWVYVPNTNINYPVVQGRDNDYYLRHDFKGSEGWIAQYGAIFLDHENAGDFTDAISFIYGHHMNDGSMLSEVVKLENASAFEESRIVYLLTPQKNLKFKTFSIVHCDAYDPLIQMTFADDAKQADYVSDKLARSLVAAKDAPDAADVKRMLALSTCDNLPTNGRYVLFCSLEEEGAPQMRASASGAFAGSVFAPDAVNDAAANAADPTAKEDHEVDAAA